MSTTKEITSNRDVHATGSNHAERRWRAIQKVINHDLPNQFIAVQGLLQLLAVDEAERLSPDGRDILRRLQGTTSRLLEMIHLLKVLGKAEDAADRPAMVTLTDLMSDAVAEARQQFPRSNASMQISPAAERIRAMPRSLHQALVLLLKVAVQSAVNDAAHLVFSADREDGAATIALDFAPGAAMSDRQDGPTIWSARTFEDRLELLLAHELVHGWGELEVAHDPSRGKLFVLRIASP